MRKGRGEAMKKILIAGGDESALSLVTSLAAKGYALSAANADMAFCAKLAECSDILVINGDPALPQILKEAGAEGADIALALTGRDEVNLVICELCKKQFRVGKTAALLNDREKGDFFKKMGIDFTISLSSAAEAIIDECSWSGEIESHIMPSEGGPEIFELQITKASPAVGMSLWEVDLPRRALVCCIMRGAECVIPRGDTHILAGDTLVMIAAPDEKEAASVKLAGE